MRTTMEMEMEMEMDMGADWSYLRGWLVIPKDWLVTIRSHMVIPKDWLELRKPVGR